jgi:hypothetical protein
MATQFKLDATRPFYAALGAGDLAYQTARDYAADVQARLTKGELDGNALREQARTLVRDRVDGLSKDAQALLADLQSDAQGFPGKAQAMVNDYVAELTKTYEELAVRGKGFVAKARGRRTQPTVTVTTTLKHTPPESEASPTVKKAPAGGSAARKTTARKTAARTAGTRKTTRKTTARTSTAKK